MRFIAPLSICMFLWSCGFNSQQTSQAQSQKNASLKLADEGAQEDAESAVAAEAGDEDKAVEDAAVSAISTGAAPECQIANQSLKMGKEEHRRFREEGEKLSPEEFAARKADRMAQRIQQEESALFKFDEAALGGNADGAIQREEFKRFQDEKIKRHEQFRACMEKARPQSDGRKPFIGRHKKGRHQHEGMMMQPPVEGEQKPAERE